MTNLERLQPQWLLPIRPSATLLTDHDLIHQSGQIVDLLPRQAASTQYPNANILRLPGKVLMPGLVNCHGHAAMTLLRGYADDYKLMTWLNDYIWPVEAKVVCAAFVEIGAWLAATEMIQSGTTCAADSYFFPQSTVQGFAKVGLRSQITTPILNFPSAWADSERHYIDQSLAFFEWAAGRPRLTSGFAPHAPYSVSDTGFEQILKYSNDLALPIHLHLHESTEEITLHQTENGNRPMARLQALGLINSRLQAVHMTDLTETEIDQLAAAQVGVAHCPESNLKLASGICPTHTLIKQGVTVALGTDGAASNNDLDMFQELRTAALLAKVSSGDPTALDAFSALEMATIKGAEFLGLSHLIGSLEPGKAADMIAVDLSDIRHQPVYHPISQIAYTATGQNVTHTWVAGELLYAERQHQSSDVTALAAEVGHWQAKIQGMS
tara:strand:+ start:458 stop:1774 length:1317 start_codon:yes stop_codon:yes gene_type:complete